MAQTSSNGRSIKRALKQALAETLTEQRDLLREIVADALEDFAMAEAIRVGQRSKPATRSEALRVLKTSR